MDKNPGVIAGKARVALAEAELKNVRFEVARQIVACWSEIEDREKVVAAAREQFALARNVAKSGPDKRVEAAQKALIDAEAKLARARSELEFLTGHAPPAISGPLTSSSASSAPAKPAAPLKNLHWTMQIPLDPTVEKFQKALRSPTEIQFTDEPLSDVVVYLKKLHHIEIQLDKRAYGRGVDRP